MGIQKAPKTCATYKAQADSSLFSHKDNEQLTV